MFLRVVPWLIADFKAPQPLDPHIAFPARDDQPDRIALFRDASASPFILNATMQSSSAFSIGMERVIAEASAPSASIHLPSGLTPASSRRMLERHAGIHDIMDHAVGELAAIQLGAAPFHARIGCAFQKIDLVFTRKTLEIFHGEDQRRDPPDH